VPAPASTWRWRWSFGLVAASTIVRDPRQALTIVALAFAAHAVLDVAIAQASCRKTWSRAVSVGCAIFNVYIGAIAYWPVSGGELIQSRSSKSLTGGDVPGCVLRGRCALSVAWLPVEEAHYHP
jgi:hypothetical protein